MIIIIEIDNVFKLKAENLYNLRQVPKISRTIVKTIYHEAESV